MPYLVLLTVATVILLLELDAPAFVITLAVATVVFGCVGRGLMISVELDEGVLTVRKFWKTHRIPADQIAGMERRQLWLSPFAIAPNADAPVVVTRNGKRVFVIAGAGGYPRVDAVLASAGRGEVPDDGRITLAEAWRRLRNRRRS